MATKIITLFQKGMDYLTIAINAKSTGISREKIITDDLRFSRFNKIIGSDEIFIKLRDHFKFELEDRKPFRDPTNKYQSCDFYSKSGANLFRFQDKIPLSLKGAFFLSRSNPYKFKDLLFGISQTIPISVSQIDFYKDYECDSIESILCGLDHRKIKIDINRGNKKPTKALHYFNSKTGDLESVILRKSTFSIKIYRKDLEISEIKDEIKSKRVHQIYGNKKIVRIEISLYNSSKKVEKYFNEFLYSRKTIETITDEVFEEFSKKYPFINQEGRILTKVQKIWRL